MAVIASDGRSVGRRLLRALSKVLILIIGLPALGLGALWAYGPYWIAPVEDFEQGPGGAMAYITLYNQIHRQSEAFWAGEPIEFAMNEAEFSGMVSSALLSGRSEADPIQKVRAQVLNGEIRVETILNLSYPQIPERYHGPVGLKLGLFPTVSTDGKVHFRITRATVGRLPIPVALLKWIGAAADLQTPGYDAQQAAIILPLSDLVARSLGKQVSVRDFTAEEGQLRLHVALPIEKSK